MSSNRTNAHVRLVETFQKLLSNCTRIWDCNIVCFFFVVFLGFFWKFRVGAHTNNKKNPTTLFELTPFCLSSRNRISFSVLLFWQNKSNKRPFEKKYKAFLCLQFAFMSNRFNGKRPALNGLFWKKKRSDQWSQQATDVFNTQSQGYEVNVEVNVKVDCFFTPQGFRPTPDHVLLHEHGAKSAYFHPLVIF